MHTKTQPLPADDFIPPAWAEVHAELRQEIATTSRLPPHGWDDRILFLTAKMRTRDWSAFYRAHTRDIDELDIFEAVEDGQDGSPRFTRVQEGFRSNVTDDDVRDSDLMQCLLDAVGYAEPLPDVIIDVPALEDDLPESVAA